MTIADTGRNLLFRHRFAILFLLLFCVLLIPPYFEQTHWIGTFWRGIFTLVLLWALYTVTSGRGVLLLVILVLIPTLLSTWLADPSENNLLLYVDNLTNILYFGLICVFLGKYILTTRRVTLEVIFAAMCLYMILAVLWAAIYTNIELYYSGAFTFGGLTAAEAGIERANIYREFIYYSFVTLSTLGYGDVLPTNLVGQSWASMEAMVGQFYIAVVIARLVSIYTVQEEKGEAREYE
jgi:hypothetical protein